MALRRIFSNRFDTTANSSGAIVISAAAFSQEGNKTGPREGNRKPSQPHGSPDWTALGGEYLHFTLYKAGRETAEMTNYLSKTTGLLKKSFTTAGNKDRRAVTVQRVSAWRLPAARLINIGRNWRNAKVGNAEYHPQALQRGDLLGNEFVITLRDCSFQMDDDLEQELKIEWASIIVRNAVKKLRARGFLNYFGLQRFGTFSTGTHVVGRLMLSEDLKAACDAVLAFDPEILAAAQRNVDEDDSRESHDIKARAYALNLFLTTGNAQEALNQLPRRFQPEYAVIQHLGHPNRQNDYHGALMAITRYSRDLYTHAYQSFVWNHAASARWQKYGNKVVPGDLVLSKQHPEPSDEPSIVEPTVDQDGEPVVLAEPSDRALTADEVFTRARVVTQAELESPDCKITIFDVVLPTPGYDILYPTNDIGDIYKEFMASEEGGGLDPNNMRRKWRDISLSGDYRKLLARPLGEVEWDIKSYGAKGDDEQFVETDLDRLEKQQAAAAAAAVGAKDPEAFTTAAQKQSIYSSQDVRSEDAFAGVWHYARPNTTSQVPTVDPATAAALSSSSAAADIGAPVAADPANNKIAVILKFQLGSSCYATMALREMMKEGGVKTWKLEYGGGAAGGR